jgi:hypothetical protein
MHSDADNERRTRVDARKDHRQTISLRTVIETSVIKMTTLFERRSVRPKRLVVGLAPILAPAKGQKPCLSRSPQPKRQFKMRGHS